MASSNVQLGMQAGSAFGPWGTAIGAAAGAATDLGAQALAGTNQASAWVDARSAFDGSGWTVSTGSSRATGGKSGGLNQSGAVTPSAVSSIPAMPGFGAGQGGDLLPWLLIGGLALYLLK
ncbi:hypothetical protein ACS5PN_03840 [Roseateles sp. NT4]|uniref:hypothetical protein n=1 Tax=Roseateles sp. NT4 TaxID=3453715 RepID=UPI003EE94B0F